jgi:spore germination protein GerM
MELGMPERKPYCPYVGLRQNRAVRFSTPSAEHRCHVSGDAMQIPVDQSSYCLSQFHTQCPLYMGSVNATKDDDERATLLPGASSQRRSKDMRQNPRDDQRSTPTRRRKNAAQSSIPTAVYGLFLGILFVAVVVYVYAGNQLSGTTDDPSLQMPTIAPTFEPLPTTAPTAEAIVVVATATPEPTSVPVAPTATVEIVVATATSQVAAATATAESAATTTPDSKDMALQLYFADSSGRLLVPVQRTVNVVAKRVAGASLNALIEGPRNGLTRIIVPDIKVNSLVIKDGVAMVDLDRRPTAVGDVRGFNAIALTLTQFDTIKRVKFLINGGELPAEPGVPSERPLINVWNPDNVTIADATVVTLYFVSADGRHDVPISKVIAKTNDVATAHVQGLLGGAGPFADVLKQVIPVGTQLRSVRIEGDLAIVDVTASFADATDRAGAVRTMVESLTSIPAIKRVQVLVDGASLATKWGNEFAGPFAKRIINPE